MSLLIGHIAAELGMSPELVAKDLEAFRDPDFGDSVDDVAGRQYIRDVRRSRLRHQMLVREHELDAAGFQAERDEVWRKAYTEALPGRRKANNRLTVSLTPDGHTVPPFSPDRPLVDPSNEADAQREARARAHEALGAFDEKRGGSKYMEFSDWAVSNRGRQAIRRVEAALDEQQAVAA